LEILNSIWDALNTQITVIQGNPLTTMGIIQLLLILVVALFAAARLTRMLTRYLIRQLGVAMSIASIIGSAIRGLVIFVGFYIALTSIGLELGILLVPLGAIGIGLGFGLQRIAENFVSGLILLTERPISDGDIIEVNAVRGVVEKIGLRSTLLRTFDNTRVTVPNSELISNQVDNWTLADRTVRIRFNVGVAYGSDVKLVEQLLRQALADHEDVLPEPEARVFFIEFGDSSLNFLIFAWVDTPAKRLTTLSDLHFAIDEAFRENDIEIPFPQRDIHLRSGSLGSEDNKTGD
jgi:small-conductance mechanosensitive channel